MRFYVGVKSYENPVIMMADRKADKVLWHLRDNGGGYMFAFRCASPEALELFFIKEENGIKRLNYRRMMMNSPKQSCKRVKPVASTIHAFYNEDGLRGPFTAIVVTKKDSNEIEHLVNHNLTHGEGTGEEFCDRFPGESFRITKFQVQEGALIDDYLVNIGNQYKKIAYRTRIDNAVIEDYEYKGKK